MNSSRQTGLLLGLPLLLTGCASHRELATPTGSRWEYSVKRAKRSIAFEFANAQQVECKSDSRNLKALLTSGHWNLSVHIEPVEKCSTSIACRDMLKTIPITNLRAEDLADLQIGDTDSTASLEYTTTTYRGIPVNQRSFHREFVEDGFWWDLHLSKMGFGPADRDQAQGILGSVTFPKKSKSP